MSLNIDNYMDDLISKYSEDDIKDALTRAKKRAADKEAAAARRIGKRHKVLAALTDWLIEIDGKADSKLVKAFEDEMIEMEKKAKQEKDTGREPASNSVKIKTDDEKLRAWIEDYLMKI